MHQLLYAMHFRSQTSQLVDHSELVRTTGSATGCVVSTMIRASGVQTVLEPSAGDLAFFESELRVTGPDQFKEDGTITIGEDSEHLLRFSTLGHGHVARGPDPGTMAGTASWKVNGGEGQFAAARGFITSTFTIRQTGERSDFQCGLIFLPE
jgi:hypothetical protein